MQNHRPDKTINGIISGSLNTTNKDIFNAPSKDLTDQLLDNLKVNNQNVFSIIEKDFEKQVEVAIRTSGNDTIIIYKASSSPAETTHNFFLIWRCDKKFSELIDMINYELKKQFNDDKITVNTEHKIQLFCVDKSGTEVLLDLSNEAFIRDKKQTHIGFKLIIYLLLLFLAFITYISINDKITWEFIWVIIGIIIPIFVDWFYDRLVTKLGHDKSVSIDLENLKFANESARSSVSANLSSDLENMEIEE